MRSFGVLEYPKIPNNKSQITNKPQISIPNDQNRFRILNFGHCDLFVMWCLEFGISWTSPLHHSNGLLHEEKTSTGNCWKLKVMRQLKHRLTCLAALRNGCSDRG
jgi:hypothetical protein